VYIASVVLNRKKFCVLISLAIHFEVLKDIHYKQRYTTYPNGIKIKPY